MAKLYFRYGAMSSAKTADLLIAAYSYEKQGKKVIVIKPKIDNLAGKKVLSRVGISRDADMIIDKKSDIDKSKLKGCNCIFVDEVQFMNEEIINEFRYIATFLNIPVICYGLRTDFKTKGFEGSLRMMEVADKIEEIKTICYICTKNKAIFNLKQIDGKAIFEGNIVDLGRDEKYKPVCDKCYKNKLREQIKY